MVPTDEARMTRQIADSVGLAPSSAIVPVAILLSLKSSMSKQCPHPWSAGKPNSFCRQRRRKQASGRAFAEERTKERPMASILVGNPPFIYVEQVNVK